ncbi:MAG: hypothetical protein DWI08_08105 [Planctomycetota bacterium]|jgi:uncharacterized membrane protein|nr:hypothetical protein [Planctomycetota bacterium]RLS85690.1 MAG: hypothetical protein DWI08_08105 [Planctomycetota bacterium]
MMSVIKMVSLAVLGVLVLSDSIFAAPPDFQKDIQPLMTKYCVECHGASKPKSGVRLDSYDALIAKSRKQSVIPGDPDKSRLVMTMTGAAKLMPPKKFTPRPTTEEIDLIKEWIKAGAKK